MKKMVCVVVLVLLGVVSTAFGAATVFLKDGTKLTGNSAWVEGNSVYLSKGADTYELSAEEVLMEETLKFNRIGMYADTAIVDPKQPQVVRGASDDLIDQIMSGSSLDRQIDQLMEQFSAGALSSAATPEVGEMLSQALAGFDGTKAKARIRAYYRSHLDNKTLEAILAWTKTPLGKKVREVEASLAVRSPEQAQQIMNTNDEEALAPQRRALIRDLDKAGRATEMAMQMVSDAMSGAMAAIPAKTAEEKKARKEIEKQAAQKKEEMMPELRRMVLASLAYTYSDLSDKELGEYIIFLKSEPARKFTKATMGAVSDLTRSMSASMIKNIVKAAEQNGGIKRR